LTILAKYVGRPRQNAYDVPDEEIDANFRAHAVNDLINKIDSITDLLYSPSYQETSSGSKNEEYETPKDLLHFHNITDCTYKNYTVNTNQNKSEDMVTQTPVYYAPE
jgi:hypothetical protein